MSPPQLPAIAFEGNGNFTLESEWDGSFNQHDTLSLNSSSDKVRLRLHVVYKEKPYIQSCDVALTANTMTSIKASVGWALVAHAFHTQRQPETRSGCLSAFVFTRS